MSKSRELLLMVRKINTNGKEAFRKTNPTPQKQKANFRWLIHSHYSLFTHMTVYISVNKTWAFMLWLPCAETGTKTNAETTTGNCFFTRPQILGKHSAFPRV